MLWIWKCTLSNVYYPILADSGVNTTELYEELRAEYPEHIPIYLSRLQALENEKDRNFKAIIETADIALKYLNVSEMLEFYGMKSDTRKDAAKIKRYSDGYSFSLYQSLNNDVLNSRMEKNKSYLLEALSKKGVALCEAYQTAENLDDSTKLLEDIKTTFNDVIKFADPTDSKVRTPYYL